MERAPVTGLGTPAYRALRHLASVVDREVIAAEGMQRARGDDAPEGKARLALLARVQAMLAREAAKHAGG